MKNFIAARNEIHEVGVHTACPCYQKNDVQIIRRYPLVTGEKGSIHATTHHIAFVLEGSLRVFIHHTGESATIGEDEFIFVPLGIRLDYEVLEPGLMMTFSLDKSVETTPECHTFRFKRNNSAADESATDGIIYPLRANDRIKYFIAGTLATELDGLKCSNYANLLVGQLMFLIQVYYPQDTYTRFYSALFNSDVAFTDFVYRNWKKHQTAGELAAALDISKSALADRFQKVFGETPGAWLGNRKRIAIYHDLCGSRKSIRDVADEYNFNVPNFTRYCRSNFGSTPAVIRAQLDEAMSGGN
jgi:AraC-like DNA-binding protein/quercetin dioxygenase-like cupin family protein